MWGASGTWPFHCCAGVVRTDLLRAVGGWATLGWCEDLSAWAAVTELTPGWWLDGAVHR